MLAISAWAMPTQNTSAAAAMRLQQTSPFNAASPVQLPRRIESRSLNQKGVWHKLDQQRSEIRQANKATTFYFYFKSGAAKRLRFDLKEKQCLKQMEDGARGHLNKSVH